MNSSHCDAELIQSEERFTDIKDAMKALNKMDFDKLISAVRICFVSVFVGLMVYPAGMHRSS